MFTAKYDRKSNLTISYIHFGTNYGFTRHVGLSSWCPKDEKEISIQIKLTKRKQIKNSQMEKLVEFETTELNISAHWPFAGLLELCWNSDGYCTYSSSREAFQWIIHNLNNRDQCDVLCFLERPEIRCWERKVMSVEGNGWVNQRQHALWRGNGRGDRGC